MHHRNKPDPYITTPHLLTKSNPTPELHLPSHEIIAPSYTPTAEFYSAERTTLRHDVYSRSSNASSQATSQRTLSSCIEVSSKQDTHISCTRATNQITTQLRLTYSPNLIPLQNYTYLLTKSQLPSTHQLDNFILQSQLSTLTLIRCPFQPRYTVVARKRPRPFCQTYRVAGYI